MTRRTRACCACVVLYSVLRVVCCAAQRAVWLFLPASLPPPCSLFPLAARLLVRPQLKTSHAHARSLTHSRPPHAYSRSYPYGGDIVPIGSFDKDGLKFIAGPFLDDSDKSKPFEGMLLLGSVSRRSVPRQMTRGTQGGEALAGDKRGEGREAAAVAA